jgi:hypothetical protein
MTSRVSKIASFVLSIPLVGCVFIFAALGASPPSTQPAPAQNPTTAPFNPQSAQRPRTELILDAQKLPLQQVSFLSKGNVVVCHLPHGQDLVWTTTADDFDSTEQTTFSGLKAFLTRPDISEVMDSGVTTDSQEAVSIYSFDVDGFHVDHAEDLHNSYGLPVITRISRAGTHGELSPQEARVIFDKEIKPTTGPALRLPIETIHYLLNQQMDYPIRLLVIGGAITDGTITFQVSGDIWKSDELLRRKTAESIMTFVVGRYDGIDRINQFSVEILVSARPTPSPRR